MLQKREEPRKRGLGYADTEHKEGTETGSLQHRAKVQLKQCLDARTTLQPSIFTILSSLASSSVAAREEKGGEGGG
jgi:hypothetical protein